MPVIAGIVTSKVITSVLIVITIALLYLVWYFFIFDRYTLVYISAFIVIPLIIVIITVFRSTERKQMHSASRLMKIVMLAGILYSVVIEGLLSWNLV